MNMQKCSIKKLKQKIRKRLFKHTLQYHSALLHKFIIFSKSHFNTLILKKNTTIHEQQYVMDNHAQQLLSHNATQQKLEILQRCYLCKCITLNILLDFLNIPHSISDITSTIIPTKVLCLIKKTKSMTKNILFKNTTIYCYITAM